ncbi:MAG: hypothetical protein IKX81_01185 [Firmicutes bacterium]|nr:hypothetical protein [Bacillota bacterium]
MTLEQVFKKREEDVKAYSELMNNPMFAKYGVLVEKISHVVMEYLHENGIDGNVDKDLISGVYFAHCWSLARFSRIFDGLTGASTGEITKAILDLCLDGEELNDVAIALGNMREEN